MEVIASYQNGFPDLEEYQLDALLGSLDRSEKELTEYLMLFSHLLSPFIIDRTLSLLDVIRSERPLVQIVQGETKYGGGITSNPRPVLALLLSLGIDIIEEINKGHEAMLSD